ncbi:MAG: hypothetical protein M3O85_07130 [Acidobacteriota bacterium]|nr:hypothetical protein [Acidobacteriota bacterium]
MESDLQSQPAGESPASAQALLPLDDERVVSFCDGGHAYTLVFSRIESADWNRVFAALRVKDHVWRVDPNVAALELLQSNLLRAQGYRVKDGSDFMALPDWKTLIPHGHKLRAAHLLVDVSSCLDPAGLWAVKLDAAWGSSESGKMTRYEELTHILKPPASEHRRRFACAMSESRIIGGSRGESSYRGRTVHSSDQCILADLYDELVVSVSGYSVARRPLEGTEQIRREMDGWHKISVMSKLFAGPHAEEGEE